MVAQFLPYVNEMMIGVMLLIASVMLYGHCFVPEDAPVRAYSAYTALCILSFYYVFMEGKRLAWFCDPDVVGKYSVLAFLVLSIFIVINYYSAMFFCHRMSGRYEIYPSWRAGFMSWPVFLILIQFFPSYGWTFIIVFVLWQIGFGVHLARIFRVRSRMLLGFLLMVSYIILTCVFISIYLVAAEYVKPWLALAVPCVMGIVSFIPCYLERTPLYDELSGNFRGVPWSVEIPKSFVTYDDMVRILEEKLCFELGQEGLDRKLKEDSFDCLDFADIANLFIIQYGRNCGKYIELPETTANTLNQIINSDSNEYNGHTYRDLYNFLQRLMEGEYYRSE